MNLWDKIHEIYSNVVIVDTTYGEKWICDDDVILYKSAKYGNIYKDEESFYKDYNAICYMPSYIYEDYEQLYLNFVFFRNREPEEIKSLLSVAYPVAYPYGFTHKNILEICNNQEEIAEYVFELLEGENPAGLLVELINNKYISRYEDLLVITEGERLEKYLYDQYRQDWRDTYITDDIERQLRREYLCREEYDENGAESKYKNFNDYIDKNGFDNIKPASFRYFIECYYPVKEYMRYLIKKGTFLEDDEIDWDGTIALLEKEKAYILGNTKNEDELEI